MLSLANVSAQQGATYYKTENYYSTSDAVGYSKWAGSAAEGCGLSGAVEHHTFTRLLAGKHPGIAVGGTKSNRRAGLDMTFSAPKSVSLQALVFGDTRLVEAHRKSVDEALRFAEAHYALYRDGPKEARVQVKGKGLLVAQFEHDTSRLKDPQLHTHNIVLNRVETREGDVKALCADAIYKHGQLIGAVYRNTLAREVKSLGYGIRVLPKGMFELDRMPESSLRRFSKRKEQIDAMGPTSYRDTRKLVLKDRKAKEGPQLREDLTESWQAESKAAGVKPLTPSKSGVVERPVSLEIVMSDALAHASLRGAVFRREDVVRSALEMSLGRFPTSAIEKSFEDAIGTNILATKRKDIYTSRAAVDRDFATRQLAEQGRASQLPMATAPVIEERVSRLSTLDTVSATAAMARSSEVLQQHGMATPNFDVQRDKFTQAIQGKTRLSLAELTQVRAALFEDVKALPKTQRKEAAAAAKQAMAPLDRAFLAPTRGQKEAIEKTLASSDQVIIWQGVAGAGKTFSMRQIVEEAKQAGIDVRGLAPSAAAALQLQNEAGIEATTLQGHLLRREQSDTEKKLKLWIVDEAGMVSAADMHALLRKAQDAKARVMLVGDTAQLSPVDAGNPFADLQKNTQTTLAHLDESLRQKDPELQKIVSHMNAGDMVKAVGALEGSILEIKAAGVRNAAAARAFLATPEAAREGTLLLARTNETRAEITHLVREGLKREGLLTNATRAETFERIDLPEPKQKYASSYVEGALLVPNRAYKSIGLKKDAHYEIERVDSAGNTLTVRRGSESVKVDLKNTSKFSMFTKTAIEIAEGDKMIWNRNMKSRDQLNNRGFVIEKIDAAGIRIRTDAGETRLLDPKERQHMEHAWALTIYKSQGRTTRDVIQVTDAGTGARDLLVAVTRATESAKVLALSKEGLKEAMKRPDEKVIAAEVVDHSMTRPVNGAPTEEKTKSKRRGLSRGRRL